MINFVEKRKISFFVSGILLLASIVCLFSFGLKLGLDFTGGSLMEVSFTSPRPSVDEIVTTIRPLNIGSVVAQPTGENGFLLRMPFLTEQQHQLVLEEMRKKFDVDRSFDGSPTVREERYETIGPSVSSQLKKRSWQAAVGVIVVIILYVAYSFRKVSKPVASWKYGVAAIAASAHDVLITLGILAVLGKTHGIELTVPIVVALLTILGYSVNDTMVAFDRIRENLLKRGSRDFDEVVNLALNETIARSINTSFTGLIAIFMLWVLGGESIQPFAFTLFIGIFLATLSSIFVTSPLLVSWHHWNKKT